MINEVTIILPKSKLYRQFKYRHPLTLIGDPWVIESVDSTIKMAEEIQYPQDRR